MGLAIDDTEVAMTFMSQHKDDLKKYLKSDLQKSFPNNSLPIDEIVNRAFDGIVEYIDNVYFGRI